MLFIQKFLNTGIKQYTYTVYIGHTLWFMVLNYYVLTFFLKYVQSTCVDVVL